MINQKIGVIIQARMGSTRLPGKVLKNIYNKMTVLDFLIKRVKLSKWVNIIIIATTKEGKDRLIIEKAKSNEVSYFIGDEKNVLKRYYDAAKKFKLDIVVRITSDCPFIDPTILDEMIIFFQTHDYDFIYNVNKNSNIPIGLDLEIFSFKNLEIAYNQVHVLEEEEHVTSYFHKHPEKFSIYIYKNEKYKFFYDLRLTIDYKEDLLMLREIYKILRDKGKNIDFTLSDILKIIENNQDLMNINKVYNWRK